MNNKNRPSRAFTLVEVLVASSIGAFITVVAMGTLSALSSSSARVQDHCDRVSEVRYAASMIARDLRNLYRDADRNATKFIAENSMEGEGLRLTFYTVSHGFARAGQPELDVYEVEYSVRQTDEQYFLMRRLWPNPNKEVEPGGLLTVLTQGVVGFQARFFDGRQWQTEWSEKSASLPKAVEVGLVFLQNDNEALHIERVLVHTQSRAAQQNVSPEALGELNINSDWNFNTIESFERE